MNDIRRRLDKLEKITGGSGENERLQASLGWLRNILGDERVALVRCQHPENPDDQWADKIVTDLRWDRDRDLSFAILPGLEPYPVVMAGPAQARDQVASDREAIEAADDNERAAFGFINGILNGGAGRVTLKDWQTAIGDPRERFQTMIAHIEREKGERNAEK